MKLWDTVWTWIKNKAGRIATFFGIVLSSIEGFDISLIKDPIEGLFGHVWVLRITLGLFLLSFARHQWVANQHPKTETLPPPNPQATR